MATSLAFFSTLQAQAHAPIVPAVKVIPAHHALLALRTLSGRPFAEPTSFNRLTRNLLYNKIPGYSGARSNLLNETKLATGTGILNGIYSKLNSTQVGSGQVVGTFYQQFLGSSSNQTFPNIYIALGANPLNVASPPATIIAPSNTAFSLIKTSSGKGGALLFESVQKLNAKAAITNPVELAAFNGLKEGQKIATTGLTGGFLTGTWYEGSGPNSGSAYALGAFAFGKNPYNVSTSGLAPTATNLLPSYLTFLNKINVKLSSAQISGNLYEFNSYDNASPFLLASGANPLNKRAANVLTQSLLKYSSYFKH
jgi:hypothetical protein